MTLPVYVNKLLRQDTLNFVFSREHLYRPKLGGVHGRVSISDALPVFLREGFEYCDRLLSNRKVGQNDISIVPQWVTFHFDQSEVDEVVNYRLLASTVALVEESEWRVRRLCDIRGKMSFAELVHKLVVWGGYLLEKEYEKSVRS